MSILAQRILTAVVLVAAIIWVLFFSPPVAAVLFFGLFLLIGSWEWSGFIRPDSPLIRLLYVVSLVLLAWFVTGPASVGIEPDALAWLSLVWWVSIGCWMLSGRSVLPLPVVILAGTMGLVPAWYAVIRLLATDNGAWLFVWIAAIVAAADTGAYFVGRAVGRIKLAPAISPGKTREGMLGGVICATLVGAGGAVLLDQSVVVSALSAAAIALFSVVGDLLVSVCKRRIGLKDSGWILPGHGGVLDRIDGLLAALPLFVLLLASLGILSREFVLTR